MENSNLKDFSYKEYSLGRLKDAIFDSFDTECTPEEIKQTVVDALQELVDYHLERMNKAASAIAQMKSTPRATPNLRITEAKSQKEWDDFWNSDN